LILFGFAFVGYGFYRTFDRPPSESEMAQLRATVKKFEDKAAEDSAREWRPLTPQEITKWADALRPFQIPELAVFWNQEVDARKLFATIKAACKQAGIHDVGSAVGGTEAGEILIVTSKDNPAGPVLVELFKALTSSVKLQQYGNSGTILVYVGEKSR
jgi:hypothetical protein